MIDEQDAFEMINFMLEAGGEETLGLDQTSRTGRMVQQFLSPTVVRPLMEATSNARRSTVRSDVRRRSRRGEPSTCHPK